MKNFQTKSSLVLRIVMLLGAVVVIVGCASTQNSKTDWSKIVGEVTNNVLSGGSGKTGNKGGLSTGDIAAGLREALRVGSKKSIDGLGIVNGFYKDGAVKIPMPKKLESVEKALRTIGQQDLADKFVLTMNRAAEKSVKSTFNIFVDAITKMTLKDAVNIYKGRDDEATRYFRRTKGSEIQKTIYPIVKKATQETGVTSNYKKITKKIRLVLPSVANNMPNIDSYVTEKTMDGIFYKIAKEEALIRKNPAARTTDILKKVFGQ